MKVISFIKLFNKISKISFLSFILFITGCNEPQLREKEVIVKRTCPQMTILKPIPKKYLSYTKVKIPFEKTDIPGMVMVPFKPLKEGSINCQKKDALIEKQKRYIRFYENQIIEIRKSCKAEEKNDV